MSSTNKTQRLKLNNWTGSDVPSVGDFNRDNVIIDQYLGNHMYSGELHTSNTERNKWNNPYYISTYFGNGTSSRTISIGSGFTPKWGIVFAVNYPAALSDYNNKAHYSYFGIVSENGSMLGLSLSGNELTVSQSSAAVYQSEYRSFNESGKTYVYIMFR